MLLRRGIPRRPCYRPGIRFYDAQRPTRVMSTQTADLLANLRKGNRRALAKAITLVESTRPEDRVQATCMVEQILQHRIEAEKLRKIPSFRIGLSGPPGVGKSSFIERFGMHLINNGHKVAVLAIDPSSARTGGSVLGDKTRMVELSKEENAYVRPSPSSGTLGGVTKHTNEAILLLEEAGYDVILIETVGVGQSETAVEDMVDMFAMLSSPAGGDELQGIKRGIVELADIIIVNKADGELVNAARQAQMELLSAIKFVRPKHPAWRPRVLSCSAKTGYNVDKVWDTMCQFWKLMEANGELSKRRANQREHWMWTLFEDEIQYRLKTHQKLKDRLPVLQEQVRQGLISPSLAADELAELFFS